jgi:hypothetical protein
VPAPGNEGYQPEPAGGRGPVSNARGDVSNGRPSRSLRVLPTPPPLPSDEDWAEPALPLNPSPAIRPRPAPPAVITANDDSSLSPVTDSATRAQLSEEIDQLYRKTVDTVSENKALAERCQSTLKQARALLQVTPDQPADPAGIEALLERVRATLARADRSVLASRRYGPPLAGYSAAWVVALLLLMVFDRDVAGWLGRLLGRPGQQAGPA